MCGKRCYGTHDWQAKGRKNVIAAIMNHNFIASSIYGTNINANVFYEWTKNSLLPNLPNRSIIVLDNARFHKRKDIQIAITDKHHTVLFLPTYSPDLNPIEKKWANVKAIRRKKRLPIDQLYERHIMMN